MKNECRLHEFLNEFTISVETKSNRIKSFNGFYRTNNYKKHLQKVQEAFKHDMLFVLPFQDKGDKKIFIKNLFIELHKRKATTVRYYQNEISDKEKNRHIRYMFFLQKRCLNVSIQIIEQSASNFNINLDDKNTRIKKRNIAKWKGENLEFIQLIHSMIKSDKIDTEISTPDEIIKELASCLDVRITKNTITSLSRSIHSSNYDYVPKIFKTLPAGYKQFAEERQRQKGYENNL